MVQTDSAAVSTATTQVNEKWRMLIDALRREDTEPIRKDGRHITDVAVITVLRYCAASDNALSWYLKC